MTNSVGQSLLTLRPLSHLTGVYLFRHRRFYSLFYICPASLKESLSTLGSGDVEFKTFTAIPLNGGNQAIIGFVFKASAIANRYVFVGVVYSGNINGQIVTAISADNQATWTWHSYTSAS